MRYLSALAFVVSLLAPSVLEAQTVVITVPQSRQLVFQSPSWTIPADAPAGMLTIRANMSQSDFDNTDTVIVLRIYAMDPSLGVWRQVAGGTWLGGRPPLDPNDPPSPAEFAFNYFNFRGVQVRGEAENPAGIRVGFSLISTP